jgi:anti-sigma-K factor RskA
MSEHTEYEELAVGWALHSLEPDDEERFAEHLPGCGQCRRTVDEATATLGRLAQGVVDARPPAELRSRLLSAAAEIPQETGTKVLEQRPSGWAGGGESWVPGGRWLLVAVAAVLALAVGMAGWNGALRHDRGVQTALADRYQQAVVALTRPGARLATLRDSDGKSIATVAARNGKASVVVLGLPTNDQQRTTYVLWGLKAAKPTALGTFDVLRSGVDVRSVKLSAALDHYPEFAVSRESGRSAPRKPSTMLASGAVST